MPKKKKSKQPPKTLLEKKLEAEAAAEDEQPKEELPDLDTVIAERDELRSQQLRDRAEYENARKRMIRETDRIRRVAAESLVLDLLPVLDHLDLALQHVDNPGAPFVQGVDMVMKQFCEVLGRHGVEPIAAEDERFDPNVHEAVEHRPSDEVSADQVMEELQRGYKLGDVVLRPSKVVVSAGPELPEMEIDEQNEENAVAAPVALVDGLSDEQDLDDETVPEEL